LKCSFNDFDQFAEEARGWDLEFHQLDRGGFHGELRQLGTQRALLTYAHFSRRLEQRGSPPEGFLTFVITAFPQVEYRWRGQNVTDQDLAIFPYGGELDGLNQPGWTAFTFSFRPEIINAEVQRLGQRSLRSLTKGAEVIRLSSETLIALRKTFQSLSSDGLNGSGVLNDRERRILEKEVPRRMLSELSSPRPARRPPRLRLRDRAVRRAHEIIHELPDEPLTVSQISRIAGVSERTLDYAFREKFQTSPKAYLKTVRLNGVRRQLRGADPDLSTVIEIAGQWGFWHMGQLAADYRHHFGELPSTTLRRPALPEASRATGTWH